MCGSTERHSPVLPIDPSSDGCMWDDGSFLLQTPLWRLQKCKRLLGGSCDFCNGIYHRNYKRILSGWYEEDEAKDVLESVLTCSLLSPRSLQQCFGFSPQSECPSEVLLKSQVEREIVKAIPYVEQSIDNVLMKP